MGLKSLGFDHKFSCKISCYVMLCGGRVSTGILKILTCCMRNGGCSASEQMEKKNKGAGVTN